MDYTKTKPSISYADFYALTSRVTVFKSLTGKEYQVTSISNSIMTFTRKSTEESWSMDLTGVHKAYFKLTDFKTIHFKPYVPLTHSPALGLLLHLRLLVKR